MQQWTIYLLYFTTARRDVEYYNGYGWLLSHVFSLSSVSLMVHFVVSITVFQDPHIFYLS